MQGCLRSFRQTTNEKAVLTRPFGLFFFAPTGFSCPQFLMCGRSLEAPIILRCEVRHKTKGRQALTNQGKVGRTA